MTTEPQVPSQDYWKIEYPASAARPTGEAESHVLQKVYLLLALRRWLRSAPEVYVGSNLLVYYRKGHPKCRVTPDIFVVWGVSKHARKIYKLWKEKQAPQVVIEITSDKTREEDLGRKCAIYAEIGVPEYYVFDPHGEHLDPPLFAYRRVDELIYKRRKVEAFSLFPDQPENELQGWRVTSEKLQLELRALPNDNPHLPYILRLFDPKTGKTLVDPEQAMEEREKLVGNVAAAEAHAKTLEAENALLRAELAKLRGQARLNSSVQ